MEEEACRVRALILTHFFNWKWRIGISL